MTGTAFGYDLILISTDFYDFTSVFPVVLIVSEKIYQTTDSLPNAEKRGESVAEYF